MKRLFFFCKTEQGGGLVEYTLIFALIALMAVVAITNVREKASDGLINAVEAL